MRELLPRACFPYRRRNPLSGMLPINLCWSQSASQVLPHPLALLWRWGEVRSKDLHTLVKLIWEKSQPNNTMGEIFLENSYSEQVLPHSKNWKTYLSEKETHFGQRSTKRNPLWLAHLRLLAWDTEKRFLHPKKGFFKKKLKRFYCNKG